MTLQVSCRVTSMSNFAKEAFRLGRVKRCETRVTRFCVASGVNVKDESHEVKVLAKQGGRN
jgi:hypothetical protein